MSTCSILALGIRFDVAKLRIQRQRYFNVLTQQPRKHAFHIGGQRIEIENSRRHNLLTTEGQQLLGQGSGPLPCLFDFQGVLAQRIAGA